jgi:uncharacterized protein (TIGR01777 family)
MDTILIAGGTGLVGSWLIPELKKLNYRVRILSRNTALAGREDIFIWDPSSQTADPEALDGVSAIINLAGENIGSGRWTKKKKQKIISSRTDSADTLFRAAKLAVKKPGVYISASASGYYGSQSSEQIFTEQSPPAEDFTGRACQVWEEKALKFNELDIRTVIIRTGVVLDKNEGALPRMLLPARLGLASPIGSGKQYVPWIHPLDLVNIFISSIEDKNYSGAYNAVAPFYNTNADLVYSIAKTLGKPYWFPNIPAFMLKLVYGEMSSLVLEGSRVAPSRLLKQGFKFTFPELSDALKNILKD